MGGAEFQGFMIAGLNAPEKEACRRCYGLTVVVQLQFSTE
jgi:hypothetical protein